IYAPACEACTLRAICGGLFDRGDAYDPGELYPVFVSRDDVVQKIIADPDDPSYPLRTLAAWREDFERRLREEAALPPRPAGDEPGPEMRVPDAPAVGLVTAEGLRRFASKRRAESRKAAEAGIEMEKVAAEPDADDA